LRSKIRFDISHSFAASSHRVAASNDYLSPAFVGDLLGPVLAPGLPFAPLSNALILSLRI
jgi:hypothetical protein